MKVITPGHEYFLDHFEDDEGYQVLSFIHKEQEGDKFVTIDNGTTNEEVLAVLIDRMQYLNTKAPCRENSIVITKLEESLMWLNKRTADRKKRGVEGTPKG
jgi:hypothetical protein